LKKTIAELIDDLITIDMKSFYFVEKVRTNTHTAEDAKKIDDLNIHRSKLKNAINEYFDEGQEIKT